MSDGILAIGVPRDLEVARELLLRGRRLALARGLRWLAVFVQRRGVRASSSGDGDPATESVSDLVAALGGKIRYARGDDVASALLRISHEENAVVLLIGHSHRPRLLRRLIRGTTEQVLRAHRSFDVIVAVPGNP
jgi:K+-sensing histidine kinase KdpD